MKRRIFYIIMAAFILLTTVGCQSVGSAISPNISMPDISTESETQSESSFIDGESSSEQSKNVLQQIKISELFTSPGKRIWYLIKSNPDSDAPIRYDDDVKAIYVVENGKITGYTNFKSGYIYKDWNLDEFDQMSDDEIIAFIEEDISIKEMCNVFFEYSPDATGNSLETEYIGFKLLYDNDDMNSKYLAFKIDINEIFGPDTIMSKKYFGIKFGNSGVNEKSNYILASKYDFDCPTEIIFNEIGDQGLTLSR